MRIRATDVELTGERKALVYRKLTPIGRLLSADEQAHLDVVLRRQRHRLRGERYYLSVKLTTTAGTHYAVAIEPYLEKALTKTRRILRRSLSGALEPRYAYRNERIHVADYFRLMLGSH